MVPAPGPSQNVNSYTINNYILLAKNSLLILPGAYTLMSITHRLIIIWSRLPDLNRGSKDLCGVPVWTGSLLQSPALASLSQAGTSLEYGVKGYSYINVEAYFYDKS